MDAIGETRYRGCYVDWICVELIKCPRRNQAFELMSLSDSTVSISRGFSVLLFVGIIENRQNRQNRIDRYRDL